MHPVTHNYAPHLGVDYGAPYGTPVRATGEGTVVAAMRHHANGNYVKIKHNSSYTTYYLHLSRFAKGIRKGKRVRQGQVIGYVGSTGFATGPHLCYRIKVGGRFVNPRRIKLPSKEPVPSKAMKSFAQVRDACLKKLYEGTSIRENGKPMLVKNPSLPAEDQMPSLY
jgi:murein DD-endopeptidase MepM/ murein hydrolase activator NlpD